MRCCETSYEATRKQLEIWACSLGKRLGLDKNGSEVVSVETEVKPLADEITQTQWVEEGERLGMEASGRSDLEVDRQKSRSP